MTTVDRVPYDADGSLLHYARTDQPGVNWSDNKPFIRSLQIVRSVRGRSSAYLLWGGADGETYPMFISDLIRLLQGQGIRKGGKVTTTWVVVKRGMNYGLAAAAPGSQVATVDS